MNSISQKVISKVPAVTLGFWIIKIICTTLGETGGDAVTMTLNLGYLIGTAIFLTILIVLIVIQTKAKKFHPSLYWATIIASTTAGTTMADFFDRSLGIGYTGGSLILLLCVLATLGLWKWSSGTISVETVNTPKTETFYWIAITFSQTLGTALGDWMADTNNFGYLKASAVFGIGLLILSIMYYKTQISRVWLFWAAFILTRPLGATLGDFLDKPISHGGLNFSRPLASLVLLVIVGVLIAILPQRAGEHGGGRKELDSGL
ncbi:MAG: hypothetical protein JWN37_71 [Candidatus Nomurabacteria bacterium]|nr:hypothetical protein [Candidatus Nomurabacteria bacterium]